MSTRKFKKGKRICTISEFDQSEHKFFMMNGKTVHRSFLMSMQYRTLLLTITNDRLYEADPVEEVIHKEHAGMLDVQREYYD